MKLYSEGDTFKLYQGNMLDMLDVIAPNSIDAVLTDPPYGLTTITKRFGGENAAAAQYGRDGSFSRLSKGFMGKEWDGSGFPKSMNIGLMIDKKNGIESPVVSMGKSGNAETHARCMNSVSDSGDAFFGGEYEIRQAQNEWAGWGTALKPAYEPIIVARKPCEGSCIDNVLMHGVGGINIDGCRIGTDEITTQGGNKFPNLYGTYNECEETTHTGRYPSNVILTYDDTDKAEVCGGMPETGEECAARYFYCAKASKRDRDEGLDAFSEQQITDGYLRCNAETARIFGANSALHRNTHPTVKPVDLMQYLVRLVTPPNGTVLDPFNGSGSTGKAAMYENRDRNAGYKYIGIELTAEYLPIAEARIKYAAGDNTPVEIPDKPAEGQITFFDLLGGEI